MAYRMVSRKGYTDVNGREVPPTVVRVPIKTEAPTSARDAEQAPAADPMQNVRDEHFGVINSPKLFSKRNVAEGDTVHIQTVDAPVTFEDVNAVIERVGPNGRVIAKGEAKVEVDETEEGAKVDLYNNSKGVFRKAGNVTAHNGSAVHATEGSKVALNNRSTGTFYQCHVTANSLSTFDADTCTVVAKGRASGTAQYSDVLLTENAQAEVDACNVIACDTSHVTASASDNKLELRDSSRAHILPSGGLDPQNVNKVTMRGGELVLSADVPVNVDGHGPHVENVRSATPDDSPFRSGMWR